MHEVKAILFQISQIALLFPLELENSRNVIMREAVSCTRKSCIQDYFKISKGVIALQIGCR